MKKSIIIPLLLLAATGCSLKEETEGFATRENSYDTYSEAQAVVNSCYKYLNSFITTNFGLMTEACTDIWYCNTSTVDANLNISPSNPGVATNVWNNCYAAVANCNEAIECINASSSLQSSQAGPLQAEARVLRALYYYYLTNTFDGVPFYTCMVKDIETQNEIQTLPRTSANEIRRALYTDLKENALPYFTTANGLKARTSEVEGNRAGYALSLMLMAKFAMWYSDWNSALDALDQLEDLYGELNEQNYPLSDTRWSVKNTAESIFELQHAWSTTGVQYSSSYGRLMLPKYDGDGVFDGVSMPELGENIASWAAMRATKQFEAMFAPLPLKSDGGVYVYDTDALSTCDRRIQYELGLGSSEQGKLFTQVAKGNNCYAGPKFWCYGMVSSYDSNNYKLFRYADAVLMKAECYAMKGSASRAVSYLNLTRRRAGLADVSSTDDIMDQIYDERARELGGELHRKYDLVRWGIWYDRTLAATGNSTVKANLKDGSTEHRELEYYPIPDTECSLSGYVLKNEAYEK